MNVFADDWDDAYPQIDGWHSNYKRLGVGKLGPGLYELLPGQTQCPYHFHHGNDEALVVLRPTGPAGAHQMVNRTDEPVRYIVAAVHVTPEVVEHVDSGKVLAMARTEGKPLWTVHRFDDSVDYFEGEEPRG